MLTVQALADFGADTKTGLARCVNKEALYLKLVKKVPGSPEFSSLRSAIAANDLKSAFEYAHGLKGITANLSLTPLLEPVSEMTELLRAGKVMDYSPYLRRIETERAKLERICED